MKSIVTRVSMIVVGAAAVLAASAGLAQASDSVTAKIPFAFVVNGTQLPAGDYVVSRAAQTPELIEISTTDGRRVALVLSQRSGDEDVKLQPRLEFERVGKQFYLSEVTLGRGNSREIAAPAAGEEEPPRR
jgi:hypothetical protein